MTEKKWVFDREKFFKMMNMFHFPGQLEDFIQSACEAHAKAEIKKFANEIQRCDNPYRQNDDEESDDDLEAGWDDCHESLIRITKAALKSRGIE